MLEHALEEEFIDALEELDQEMEDAIMETLDPVSDDADSSSSSSSSDSDSSESSWSSASTS
ncbi:MAG: hypothetical protein JWM47_4481 [Acidimicrobiales bacterium]|nr:hypothetical protein [Acidimicrobiales bacterium]